VSLFKYFNFFGVGWVLFCLFVTSTSLGQGRAEESSEDSSLENEEKEEESETSDEPADGLGSTESKEGADSFSNDLDSMELSKSETKQSATTTVLDNMTDPRNRSEFERPRDDKLSTKPRQIPQRPAIRSDRPKVPRLPMIDRAVLQSIVRENNPVIAQVRKTGKMSADTSALARFGLREAQTNRFYEMSPMARKGLLATNIQVVRRLLSMDGFGKVQGDAFFEYQSETRMLILGLDDGVLVPLLNEGIEEDLLQESLTKMNLDSSKPARMPKFTPDSKMDDRAKEMSVRLIEGGNGHVFAELNALSDNSWDEDVLRVGEVADILLRDYDLADSSPRERLSANEALANPFFVESASLFEELKIDGLVFGGGRALGGRSLIVKENAKAINPYFKDGAGEVVVVASKSLELGSDITWDVGSQKDTRLVFMSSGDLQVTPGATLSTVTSDLVLATQRNLLLKQVSLGGASEVAIRGMRDVSMQDVSIRADVLATIKARRDLNVDGLSFNRDISRIVMEATTMRLRNVNFPGLAQVRLNTLKGAVDGRYPNFGASIPAVEQIGRVNFIENVRSGGNLLHDRASFDAHGKNIEIGKIARP